MMGVRWFAKNAKVVMVMKVNIPEIKRLRKQRRMSQQDMAKLLGHNNLWAYWRQENGEVPFTAEQLYTIANHFGVPIGSLYAQEFAENAK